jgi:hypothetical protein
MYDVLYDNDNVNDNNEGVLVQYGTVLYNVYILSGMR